MGSQNYVPDTCHVPGTIYDAAFTTGQFVRLEQENGGGMNMYLYHLSEKMPDRHSLRLLSAVVYDIQSTNGCMYYM